MVALAMFTMPLEDLRALRRYLRFLWVHHPVNDPAVYEPLYALFMATGTVMDVRYMTTV